MGYKRILTISEDDTRKAEVSEAAWQGLTAEVGAAVLSLCAVEPVEIDEVDRLTQNERYQRAMDAYRPKTLAALGNHSGAVRLVGREHSTGRRLYLFAGGLLQPLYDVSDEDLDLAEQLIRGEWSERAKRRASSADNEA